MWVYHVKDIVDDAAPFCGPWRYSSLNTPNPYTPSPQTGTGVSTKIGHTFSPLAGTLSKMDMTSTLCLFLGKVGQK